MEWKGKRKARSKKQENILAKTGNFFFLLNWHYNRDILAARISSEHGIVDLEYSVYMA